MLCQIELATPPAGYQPRLRSRVGTSRVPWVPGRDIASSSPEKPIDTVPVALNPDDREMNPSYELNSLAAMQGGCVTLDQAIGAGMTRDQITYRLRSGAWQPVGRLGYRVSGVHSKMDKLRSAIALLPGAVVSHFSAAVLLGMNHVARDHVSVAVHTQTTHDFPDVLVVRYHDLMDSHLIVSNGLPVTTVPRTIVDLAGRVPLGHLAVVLDDAVAAGLTSMSSVAEVLEEVARKGKPGVANLRTLLEERTGSAGPTSALEAAGRRILEVAGLGGFVLEYSKPWARHRRFDVAFPNEQVAIEWDSRRWHSQVAAFDRDRRRDAEAATHGWTTLRFSWDDVHRRTTETVLVIRTVLERARLSVGSK
jgi:very-short-patch-repair endonuclease